MNIIYTHDGMIGLSMTSKVIWCSTKAEATNIMFSHYAKLGPSSPNKQEIYEEICKALDTCAARQDDVAEFGVFGTFMYTTRSKEE